MNFQQRYLRLSKEIKNIKEAQSKVVLNLRSVVYSTTQQMHYDHYYGSASSIGIQFCDADGNPITNTEEMDFMRQVYCTCSNSSAYLSYIGSITGGTINMPHPPAWETGTYTVNVQIITSEKAQKIRITNSYTGETIYLTEGEIIG